MCPNVMRKTIKTMSETKENSILNNNNLDCFFVDNFLKVLNKKNKDEITREKIK
jgi:hypothetical protein